MESIPNNRREYESAEVVAYYAKQSDLQPCEALLFSKWIKFGDHILDMGVGGGRTTPHLAALAGRYIGADYSEGMINVCRVQFPGIDFRHCDATDLSEYSDNEFDAAVFSFNGIDCIPSDQGRAACFRELARVVKPGGVVIFSSHNARLVVELPNYHNADFIRVIWRTLRSAIVAVRNILLKIKSGAFRSGDAYILEPIHGGMLLYQSCPAKIQAQLDNCGLSIVDQELSTYPARRISWAAPWIYYVAQKR